MSAITVLDEPIYVNNLFGNNLTHKYLLNALSGLVNEEMIELDQKKSVLYFTKYPILRYKVVCTTLCDERYINIQKQTGPFHFLAVLVQRDFPLNLGSWNFYRAYPFMYEPFCRPMREMIVYREEISQVLRNIT